MSSEIDSVVSAYSSTSSVVVMGSLPLVPLSAPNVPEMFRKRHLVEKYEKPASGGRALCRVCVLWKEKGYRNAKTSYFCLQCKIPLCHQQYYDAAHARSTRMCFYNHVCLKFLKSGWVDGDTLEERDILKNFCRLQAKIIEECVKTSGQKQKAPDDFEESPPSSPH